MADCIFCKIINKEIPLDREPIYEDENFLVIFNKFPQAEIHILLILKKHINSVAKSTADDRDLLGGLLVLAAKVAREKEIEDFKLIFNNGKHAEIHHLHLHLLSGSNLKTVTV